jgi:plastocyanin
MISRRRRLTRYAVAYCALLCACGGSPSAPSDNQITITIGPAGVSPAEVRIRRLNGVRFVNNDVRPHAIASDPFQTHTDCPATNGVGFLNPGESGSTRTFTEVRTCGFHDHLNEFDTTLKGRIIVEE